MAKKLQLDIYSDQACPWCYVAKKRLDKALAVMAQESVEVDIQWHAYMIDPRTNPKGEEYLAYNKRRWGGDSWTQDLRRSGRPDGAAFVDWRWWPNTLHAHRLVALASKHGKGHEATELLFQKTYEQGQNISDLQTLTAAGQELGLPGVEAYLQSDEGVAEVTRDDATAKERLSIRGVPFFIFTNPEKPGGQALALSGAQPTRAFLEAMQQALAPEDSARSE